MAPKVKRAKNSEGSGPRSPDDNDEKDDDLEEQEYDESFYDFDVSANGEGDRYTLASGWDPHRKEDERGKKLRADFRRKHPQIEPCHNMLETRHGSEWMDARDTGPPPELPLFGNFWRTGELAILFADTGLTQRQIAQELGISPATVNRYLNRSDEP